MCDVACCASEIGDFRNGCDGGYRLLFCFRCVVRRSLTAPLCSLKCDRRSLCTAQVRFV